LLTQGAIGFFPPERCTSSLQRVTTCESEHLLSERSVCMSSRPVTPLSFAARRQVIERMVPFYREASLAQKALLLDQVVLVTGYARKYAIGLLNRAPKGTHPLKRPRSPRYGHEVQHALVQAWKAARFICAKRLIPFFPTLVPALERHGHLHLSEETRRQLLSMSPATADRVLRAHRTSAPHGFCTTQAGPLLKEQIPIRTFQHWDDARPGFLEADLVAHCGGHCEGCFLYTLTLTDVATGWTECLPVLYKSPEAILAAFQQARTLFPFPILGLDVDNGGEFINETLLSYCEAQQITFTRGRPDLKADQCFVEQKNGAIVRKMVGYDRLVGEQAARQLRELYRAVRLYVNCFQPSMKMLSKHREGEKVRRVYDTAKTPLHRLVLSGVLPAERQQLLCEVEQALDPLHLSQQLEDLQQAVWHASVTVSPQPHVAPAAPVLSFCIHDCLQGMDPAQEKIPAEAVVLQLVHAEAAGSPGVLDWPRTSKDPFEGEWERILWLVLSHPEWSGRDLFQQMQRLFPGRYRSSQQRTLQIGLRKIRARLLSMQEPWPQEVIQAARPTQVCADSDGSEQKADWHTHAFHVSPTLPVRELPEHTDAAATPIGSLAPGEETSGSQARSVPSVVSEPGDPLAAESALPQAAEQRSLRARGLALSIEQAIESYLQEQRVNGRSVKTLEWHQTALGLLQQYLVDERHLHLLCQITEVEVRGWVAFLGTTPSVKDTTRSAGTIVTYARSARAFCHWAVRNGHLDQAPIVRGTMPKRGKKVIHLIEPEEFERLLLSCRAAGECDASAERAAARNRAILWVFLDTGMRVGELCGLRLGDVDLEHRALRVQSTGGGDRWMTLSPNGWYQVLSYLERDRPKEGCRQGGDVEEDHLFLSEWYRPLTSNSLTLLFDRLWKRAGISDKPVSPSVLRDTFAVRFLQAGGELDGLGSVLGLRDKAALKRYAQVSAQKEPAEEHPSELVPTPHTRRRRHRRSSSAATRNQRQRAASKRDGVVEKKPVTDAEEDT
jgi:site-specific recombinase XerD